MAYRTARGARRSYSRTSARGRTSGSGYRKSVRTGKRAPARGSRTQTVRIELVGMPASPISRAMVPAALQKPVAPKKAKH